MILDLVIFQIWTLKNFQIDLDKYFGLRHFSDLDFENFSIEFGLRHIFRSGLRNFSVKFELRIILDLDFENFSVEIELRFILGLDLNIFQIKLKLRINLNLLDAHAEECHKQWLALGLISVLMS